MGNECYNNSNTIVIVNGWPEDFFLNRWGWVPDGIILLEGRWTEILTWGVQN